MPEQRTDERRKQISWTYEARLESSDVVAQSADQVTFQVQAVTKNSVAWQRWQLNIDLVNRDGWYIAAMHRAKELPF